MPKVNEATAVRYRRNNAARRVWEIKRPGKSKWTAWIPADYEELEVRRLLKFQFPKLMPSRWREPNNLVLS